MPDDTSKKPTLWKRLKNEATRAFAIPKDEPFSEEDHHLLDKLAEVVVKRGMAEVAVMTLETFRPLNFVGSQALHFLKPFAEVVFDPTAYQRLAELLERRNTLPLLMDKIEARSHATDEGEHPS